MSIQRMSMAIHRYTMHVSGAIRRSPKSWWITAHLYRLQTKTVTHRWTKQNRCWPSASTIWPSKVDKNCGKSVSKIKVGWAWRHVRVMRRYRGTRASIYVIWSCIRNWPLHHRAIHGAGVGKRMTLWLKFCLFVIAMRAFHVILMRNSQNYGYFRIQIFCQWSEHAIRRRNWWSLVRYVPKLNFFFLSTLCSYIKMIFLHSTCREDRYMIYFTVRLVLLWTPHKRFDLHWISHGAWPSCILWNASYRNIIWTAIMLWWVENFSSPPTIHSRLALNKMFDFSFEILE